MSSFAYEPSEEVPSLLTFLCFFKLFFLQDNIYSENEGGGVGRLITLKGQ